MAKWNLRVSSNSVNEGLLTVFTVLLAVEGERATDEEYITGDGKAQIKGMFHHGSKSLLFKVPHHTILQEIDEIPQCSSHFCTRSDQTPRETKASQWLMIQQSIYSSISQAGVH